MRSPADPLRFALMPFRKEEQAPDLAITGTIGRRGDALSLRCSVAGNLSKLAIPAPAERPERKNRLWEETCLEVFLGEEGSERYWEFNLSPAGHWNIYRFASYRKEMREEPAFSSLPFLVRTEPDALEISLDLEITGILPAGIPIEAAVCAVIKTRKGMTTYWALVHPGPRPDFHRRDGFAFHLPTR